MTSNPFTVLVTGTNGGLGLGICLRLIDDFLKVKDTTRSLLLIFTTRSARKGADTLETLRSHLHKYHGIEKQKRVQFQNESVDLTSLLSIRDLSRKLLTSDLPQIDAIVCNAGIGGWTGLNWPRAIKDMALDFRTATTWPEYKLGTAGSLTKPQIPGDSSEPPLGEVFCANLFGHFMFVHWLMPLLRACPNSAPSKVIWVSSIEPQDYHFKEDDLQGLYTSAAYEHGKRATDILVLTCNQPGCMDSVASFASTSSNPLLSEKNTRPVNTPPSMHVFHPGILCTAVMPKSALVNVGYVMGVYLARLTGAAWSTVQPYAAADAATWLILTSADEIRMAEVDAGSKASVERRTGHEKVKWGTAATPLGSTHVRPVEVVGWGINGSGLAYVKEWWGGKGGKGRKPGATEAKQADVDAFVELGARVWREMEKLRKEWEDRIVKSGV